MPRYLSDPPIQQSDLPSRTAVLLINLGTPDEPTPAAVKAYLAEFLSDPRVVEIPRLLWLPILHGIILNVRPRKSAAKYAQIWRAEGSPLRLFTQRQAQLLKGLLGEKFARDKPLVRYAMRYGRPAIEDVLDDLKSEGCERIVVVPLYPQYAASTTATAFDVVAEWCGKQRNIPALRTVKHFHDHPGYITALANNVREYWRAHGRPDKLLMSFHGLPRYTYERGDPYYAQCTRTAALLATELGLKEDMWQMSFQSRFGRAEWLQPYTAATLEMLAAKGLSRVDVVCPGFVADCLETLEEIALEGKAIFLQAGGREFHALPCLNDRQEWIAALAQIVEDQFGGWIQETPLQAAELRSVI
ncbi:MAG TPA: ferrochelatase [Burkholderiales bacterium]|nr:ferrochelatase [Burkholderiales bacterium]